MRQGIIEYLQSEIKRRCELPSNFFGMGCFYHIKAVVDNAVILAKQSGADEEIVIIAAWLHDVASITDYSFYTKHKKPVWKCRTATNRGIANCPHSKAVDEVVI